ncbi:unnamed protein product [Microthlaspi erraticum]|uniref:Uncharacterized protein n=1 Tax=Microthlaspi erraticum TaxID=1685480 RepID=A0A6D2KF86_9BRAS|nr:unnamed protein product [Microthlaspi erraticum]
MFGMEVFCTFPSNYVEAQKHGNERRIKIGDEDETLRTGKRTKPSGRGNVHWSNLVLSQSSGDTSYFGEDKDDHNQYGEDMQLLQWSQNHSANQVETLSYWNGTKLCWTNRGDTQLLMKDKDCPNQSDGDTEVLNGDEIDLDESGCNTNH